MYGKIEIHTNEDDKIDFQKLLNIGAVCLADNRYGTRKYEILFTRKSGLRKTLERLSAVFKEEK